jgi:cytochrome b561
MNIPPSTTVRYTTTAQALHWFMALLIFGLLALGFYMSDLRMSPQKLQLYAWHKWAGVSVFALLLVRVSWRLSHRPPELPPQMGQLQRRLSHVVHGLLYCLMLALPLSGWLMSSAKGYQTVWFGILPIPDLLAKDKALGEILESLHEALAFAMIALVVIHICAALKHQWVDRDHLISRMWP